jgi:hypothetical protein
MERSAPVNRACNVILIGLLLATAIAAPAQAPSPAAAPQTATTTKQVPFGKELKKTVGLLTVGFIKDGTLYVANGTCFFISYPDDRLPKDTAFTYLVTNRHVAQPGIEDGVPFQTTGTTLRLNRKDAARGSDEIPLVLSGARHWYFSSDDAVDLAVLPFGPDQSIYDFKVFPLAMLATKDEVDKNAVGEGDRVMFTGLFYQFPGLTRFEPIVREGILAMMPDEQLSTTLRKPGNLYLADVHVFGGNSGSPLLINLAGNRNGALMLGSRYELLGIVSGFYHEDANLTLTIADTYKTTVEQNSGIAMVVPADALKALLDSPELKAVREAEIMRRK